MKRNSRRTDRKQAFPQTSPVSPAAQAVFIEGIRHHQAGRLTEAESTYRRAVTLRPDNAEAHYNLGILLAAQGRADEAIACYRAAIRARPAYAEAHNNLGILLEQQRQFDAAAACYRSAIACSPDDADAHNNLGNVLRTQRQLDEAVACYRNALDRRPAYPEAYNNLGVALREQGRLNEAVACYRRALDIRPGYAEAHNNLGIAFNELKRLDEAVACYQRALEINPNYAEAFNNLGITRKDQRKLEDAASCFSRALELNPHYTDAKSNLGITLQRQGKLDAAIACYREAVAASPDFPLTYNNLGTALQERGQLQDALAAYQQAIALNPDYPEAHNNTAMVLLAQGDLAAGWQENEWRWKTPQMASLRRDFAQPQWRGEPAAGQTLLIHAEQGFGDTLQFCRYASLAAEKGLRVIIQVPRPLVRLMRGLAGVDRVLQDSETLTDFDLHCPMLSLPLALGTTLATIPAIRQYLHADTAQAEAWQKRLAAMASQGPRIGLAWAGNPHNIADQRRSLPLERLAPLFTLPELQFFSLQKDGPATPDHVPLTDVMNEMADFADTAALIANLDLVIAVDTAVAHLAAALGKPVWLLNRFDPCWRWLTERDDSPWYPTVRQFRQPTPGDWDAVVAAVRSALRTFNPSRNAETNFAEAVRHHQAGRLTDAEIRYRQVLAAVPRHADSLHLLGVVAGQTGRHALAIDLINQAIALNPEAEPYHANLAISLRHQNRLDEARTNFTQGNSLKAQGRLEGAIACYRTALDLNPDDPDTLNNLGNTLRALGRLDEAIAAYQRALSLKSDHAEVLNNLGIALQEQNRLDEAITCYRRTIALKPGSPEAHTNLGTALQEQERLDEAVACYRTAIALSPAHPDAHSNLGTALHLLGRLEEAATCFRDAIDRNPNFAEAHNNLGTAYAAQARLEEAAACHRQAIALKHDYPEAHNNLAMVLLAQGNMDDGWAEYEWRLRTPLAIKTRRDFAQPRWRGEAAPGQTLLIHAEQGFGDSLQFCRYATLAAERGLRVIIEVPHLLVRLMRGLAGVDHVVTQGEALPPFDLHCPMLSLPLALGTTLATIPGVRQYLYADAAQRETWRTRLASIAPGGRRVGLVWAGNPRAHLPAAAAVDRRRSIAPDRLAPLFSLQGAHFFSLQKGGPPPPDHVPLTDLMHEMADFADTAALIANLDLVISVDTAVAHLAAALGKPVWLLDRFDSCWRWLTGRQDSPWYPTLRLFRQKHPGDWDTVVAEVREALQAFAPDHTAVSTAADLQELFANAVRHHQAEHLVDAERLYRQVLAAVPHHADSLHLLGVIAGQTGRHDLAIERISQAIALNPNAAPYHANLGISLRHQYRLTEAVACFRTAVTLTPDDPAAYNALGIALKAQGSLDEAIACYRRAIDLQADYPDAHANLAMALLARGDLTAGWAENEWRWQTSYLSGHRRAFTQPQWFGEAADGRTLLIHAEQGFGDTIQFCRFAALAAARGLRVIMQVPPVLLRLLSGLTGVDQLLQDNETLPDFDLHCPMLSLPLALGTTLATIPGTDPYLHADPAQVTAWQTRLSALGDRGPRIGLAWAGNPRNIFDQRRSLAPDRLTPLFNLPGAHFFSLQKGGPPVPDHVPLTDFMTEAADFADTAALIASLDLVIAVDTAVAHLAAALGKPVWLLDRFDPCWRWLTGRRNSPWYPTLRLFRQPRPGDWDAVIQDVRDALRSFLADRLPPGPDSQALFAEAVRHHQAERLADAETLYWQVLAAEPRHADSRHLLGVIAGQTGRHELAIEMISQAIALKPKAAPFHSNLGISLRQQGRMHEAVASFRTAADLLPDDPEAHINLGVALNEQGRLEEAADCYRKALDIRPHLPKALGHLGNTLTRLGRLDEAIACYRAALSVKPDDPVAQAGLANALQTQGHLDEAVASCRTAVDAAPHDPRAYFNLGAALRATGPLAEAIACYRKAIDLKPDYPEAHNNLGNALRATGQADSAIASYRRAIDLEPNNPDAHNNLGIALQAQGRLDDAIACYRTTLDLRRDISEAHNNLGTALQEQGKLDEAATCYRTAVSLKPAFAEAHNNLGTAAQASGRLDEAVACYRQAIAARRNYPAAHNNLGNALREQGRLAEAEIHCRTALDLSPDFAEAHNSLGITLQDQGRTDEAIACFRRALDLNPADAEACCNLGSGLRNQGQLTEAIACFSKAIGLKPNHPEAHNNLGNALFALGRLDEAIAAYRKTIALTPDDPNAHSNLAMALLAQGDMPAGWTEYEWRWKTPAMTAAFRHFNQPQWRGEAAAGRTLLIHAEQGYGDTLQFCRYAPLAATRGLRVIMEVPKALERLMRGLPGVERVIENGQVLPVFDLHVPLLSLPLAFGTTLATIPSSMAYLHAEAADVTKWRERLDAMPTSGKRIGLLWAGNPRNHLPAAAAIDRRRSIAPDQLTALFDLPGAHFFSLQKDGPRAPDHVPLTDLMNEMADFADTAALIANLDLVISVDTAVAHLAGALGKPVWLLDRFDSCWRWLTGRRDSPWYPTLRLFRQPKPGDWAAVIAEVKTELQRLLSCCDNIA